MVELDVLFIRLFMFYIFQILEVNWVWVDTSSNVIDTAFIIIYQQQSLNLYVYQVYGKNKDLIVKGDLSRNLLNKV